jgi:hypothetical protein
VRLPNTARRYDPTPSDALRAAILHGRLRSNRARAALRFALDDDVTEFADAANHPNGGMIAQ